MESSIAPIHSRDLTVDVMVVISDTSSKLLRHWGNLGDLSFATPWLRDLQPKFRITLHSRTVHEDSIFAPDTFMSQRECQPPSRGVGAVGCAYAEHRGPGLTEACQSQDVATLSDGTMVLWATTSSSFRVPCPGVVAAGVEDPTVA